MTTRNPLPDTLIECPLCDAPLALDLADATVECPTCQVGMDLAPASPQVESTARQRLASAA